MFYLIIFLILLIFAFIESFTQYKNKYILYGIVFLLLTFISGFRYETGVDWVMYEGQMDYSYSLIEAFERDKWDWLSLRLDVGYSILLALIKTFGGGVQTLFFIIALVTQILLYLNLRKYSSRILLSYLIYYCFFFFVFDLSGIRQGLAIQLFFYSIRFIINRSFLKFLICIIFATLFHWSAAILFPLYFFLERKISVKLSVFIVVFSTLVFTFQIKWLGAIMGDFLTKINSFTLLAKKVEAYTTNDFFARERSWDKMTIYAYLRIIALIFFNYLFREKYKDNKYYNIFYNLLIIQFLCIFTFYEFFEISDRYKSYFLISEVILIPFIIIAIKEEFLKQLSFALIAPLIFANSYIYFLEAPTAIAYNPYQNYIIHKVFDKKNTGYKRFKKHIQINTQED